MRKHYLLFATVLLVAGCATTEKAKTLGDLGGESDIKIDTNAPIVGARDKAMDNYWEFMAGTKEREQKVEAMRRLADLEMERSDERFQKQAEVLGQSQAKSETDMQTLRENIYKGAIKLYEDALKIAGHSKQRVGILYQLSKAYEQAGDQKKGLLALTNLLDISPNAPNRDELNFRRGEILFDLHKFHEAELAYNKVMMAGAGSVYFEKALNKRGWSLFKQGKYRKAISSFLDLVDRKLSDEKKDPATGKSKLSRGDAELVNDVFRAVTLSFNELGGAKSINSYFESSGHKDYEMRIYGGLAEFYVDQGRMKDAADTYHAFAAAYPFGQNAYKFDLKAMDIYSSAGFADLLMNAKQAFVKRYRINGEYWKHFQLNGNAILVKLRPVLRKNSEDVVRFYHAAAQKSKSMQDYQKAFLQYKQYLKWFGQDKDAQKMNFLYAELLFEAGQYELAVKEYEKTAYQYVRFGADAEAGYAALLAYEELAKHSKGKQKEIWSQLAVGSAMRFGKKFPNDKRAAEVLTRAAQEMFALKKYSQASVTARQILELSGDENSKSRLTAWKIIARSEFEKGDYTRAEVAYKVALSLIHKGDKSRSILKEGLAAAVYKQGEYMKSKGNLQAAIEQYNRVSKVSNDSKVIVAAKFDAATTLMAAKNWKGAISKLLQFRQQYPDQPLTKRVSENLVIAYLATGQSINAAKELEKVAAAKQNGKEKREAFWQAVELYEKAGTEQQIIASLKEYIDKFPSPMEQATEARQKLAEIFGKTGRASDRRYWLSEIIRQDSRDKSESTPRTHYLAAKASLVLAKPTMEAFQQVKLVEPLKENLKRKKQKMQDAVDAFTRAANYDIAEVTTASVYWLGEIYNDFAKELMDSQRPPGLTGEELEQYNILLEEQAYPFEEKSITIHETNVGRIAQGTYDEWVKKSFKELKSLDPVRYAKVEKSAVAQRIYY
jgi:tetratricopeptide (TPR) repeat protein